MRHRVRQTYGPGHPSAHDQEAEMPSVSRSTAATKVTWDGVDIDHADLEGGYAVCFERHTADADLAPLFRGLPGDRAQLPRWGYVIAGRISFRVGDREETFEAGEAYYVAPGHTPRHHAGTEIVEFSPTALLDETIPVVLRNLGAGGVEVEVRGSTQEAVG
jgi:hypothetical protein